MTAGAMTYDLRRLRLHGLITRVPHTHRYTVTPQGLRTAVFFRAVHVRILRRGLALTIAPTGPVITPLRAAFEKLDHVIDRWCHRVGNAA
jgi:predicted MarR family transcription regulator